MSSILLEKGLTPVETRKFLRSGIIVAAEDGPEVDGLLGEEVKMKVLVEELRRAQFMTPRLEQLIEAAGYAEVWHECWDSATSDAMAIRSLLDVIDQISDGPEFADYEPATQPAVIRALAQFEDV